MTSAPAMSLDGRHILLVEDQILIALDTEAILLELGAGKVHTFTEASPALAWLASNSPHVAVLDINLGGVPSYPLATALQRAAVPFVFTTGYDDITMIPEAFAGIGVVHKPYTTEALRAALHAILNSVG